jgi:hypothetical protein
MAMIYALKETSFSSARNLLFDQKARKSAEISRKSDQESDGNLMEWNADGMME